jgi:hypothetical protein
LIKSRFCAKIKRKINKNMLIRFLKKSWNNFKDSRLVYENEENTPSQNSEQAPQTPEQIAEESKNKRTKLKAELPANPKPTIEIAEELTKKTAENDAEFTKNATSYYQEVSKEKSPEELKKLAEKREKAKTVSIAELRGGYEWLGIKENEYEKKYTEISKAYLDDLGDGSFKVKSELDEDETVKFNLGAGDILPPSVTAAAITDLEGNTRIGKRMTINERINERIIERTGYYDEHGYIPIYGNYVIRPTESINEKSEEYKNEIKNEKENYENRKTIRSRTRLTSSIDKSTAFSETKNLSPIDDTNIIKKLNNQREKKDGDKIIQYLEECCISFDIDSAIVKELIQKESAWKIGVKNASSSATGLGQFLTSSWYGKKQQGGFISKISKYKNKTNLNGQKLVDSWETDIDKPERNDPYAMIFAVVVDMYETKIANPDLFNKKDAFEQGIYFYLAHHEGRGGLKNAIAVINEFQKANCKTKNEMLAEYDKNPQKYLLLMNKGQQARGIRKLLHIYFDFAQEIGIKAYKRNNQETNTSTQTNDQEALDNATVRTLENSPRNGKATNNIPYRYFEGYNGISNGGCPGYPGGNNDGPFNIELAKNQLRNLYNNGVKNIVSLAKRNEVKSAISELKKEGIILNQIIASVDNTGKQKNIKTAKEILSQLNNKKTYIHCRHGTHRATTMSVEIFRLLGYENPFEKAGLNPKEFRSTTEKLLLNTTR